MSTSRPNGQVTGTRSLKLRGIMQPLWRILIASALAFPGTAALAQNGPATVPSSSAPDRESIGPPQLSNFSLGGKVTRPAAPQQAAVVRPASRSPKVVRDRETADVINPEPARSPRAAPQAGTAQSPPARPSAARTIQPQSSSDSLQAFANPAPPQPQSLRLPVPATTAEHPNLNAQSAWLSGLLWFLAAAAAAGAGGWFFLWQRPRTRLAPAGPLFRFDAPAAEPALPPVPPADPPRAEPPAPKPAGIVSTRLRPWIELQFTPGRVIFDTEKAMLEFEMAVFNSGSAPARDILVEGALFNAGPMQDQQIAGFFENPVGQGNRLPLLAPLQRLSMSSAIILSKAQLVPLEIEGRPLLVPLAGFNALYRWGNGSNGQTSASYLVGKQTDGEKLAPFRLDLGPRIFRKLAAREHEIRVRK